MKGANNWLFIIIILLALIPILWFLGRGNVIINGIDTNFPLDPISWFLRRLYVWDSASNAGRDFSSSVAGLFFHLIQVIPYSIGASLQFTQIISLVFWFFLIILGSLIFARSIFPGRFLIQLLFIVLYSFNIYLFNTWENVKVANLSLVAAIPIGLAIFLKLKEKQISFLTAALYSVLLGIVLSGTGLNPSYFITFLVIIFVFFIANIISSFTRKSILDSIKTFVLIGLIIVLTNSFWILPTSHYVLNTILPTHSIGTIGYANWVDSLSENTSLFNILRLQGAWDWYVVDAETQLPFYIPYALNYFHNLPFLLFSFLIPVLVVLSLIIRKKERNNLYIFFSICLVLGVFLGVGTHQPTGVIFSFLSEHVPFFTLFRSPWYIFTPLVFISYAGLVSLLFSTLREGNSIPWVNFKYKNIILKNIALNFIVVVLVIGNLLYSYPLVTGKIFRPARQDGFFINFPEYVFDAAEWLKNNDSHRIVGYPVDEIEQFKWGYRGIESILGLLTNEEVFYNSLIAPDSNISLLLKEFFLSLQRATTVSATNIAQKLNIDLLFEKSDQKTITFTLPKAFKLQEISNFGDWNFYRFPQGESLPKLYSAEFFYSAYPHNKGIEVISVLDTDEVLVNSSDSVVNNIDEINNSSRSIVLAQNEHSEDLKKFGARHRLADRLLIRDMNKAEFVSEIPKDGYYTPILERYRLEDFGLDINEITVLIDDEESVWSVKNANDSYVYFQPIFISVGKHTFQIKLNNKNLIPFGDFESELGYTTQGGGKIEVISDGGNKVLSIQNNTFKDVAAVFSLGEIDVLTPYVVQLRYKQLYGNDAAVIVNQGLKGKSAFFKIQSERFPYYLEWQPASFFFDPVKAETAIEVLLVAPPFLDKNPLGTKVLYDNLELYKVFTNRLMFISDGKNNEIDNKLIAPKIEFRKISPVLYEGTVSSASGPHVIIFSENYSPEWELSAFDSTGKRLIVKPAHFSANYFANAWFVKGTPQNYTIRIYYTRQNLFLIGGFISAGTLFGGALGFIFKWARKKNKLSK